MTQLKKEEAEAEKSLADLQESLATKEQELLTAKEDLKATTEDKVAIEDYLEKIKPGCDFITTNFDLREKNRKTESYGDCKEQCVKDSAHVNCKACMADVTKPAYCA